MLILLITIAPSCSRSPEASAAKPRPLGKTVAISAPLGLPPVPIPASNPPTEETIRLGRKLFYDPKVSVDNTIACASCHNPTLGFTDRQRVSTGVNRKFGKRNAPTVLNAAYVNLQFWDGRAGSLEEQAAGPIANPVEMNHTHDVFLPKLNSTRYIARSSEKPSGEEIITMEKVEMALASFERTLLSGELAFEPVSIWWEPRSAECFRYSWSGVSRISKREIVRHAIPLRSITLCLAMASSITSALESMKTAS